MGRRAVDVPVLPLAHRRAEAAAACGVSVEVFDLHIRAHIPAVRLGGVVVYPVAGITAWPTSNSGVIADDIRRAA